METTTTTTIPTPKSSSSSVVVPSPVEKKKKKKIIKVIKKKIKKIIKVRRKKIKKTSSPITSPSVQKNQSTPSTKSVVRRIEPAPKREEEIKIKKKKKKNRLKKVKKQRSESSTKRSPEKKKKSMKKETKPKVKLEEKTKVGKDKSGIINMQFGEEDRRPGQKYPSPSPGEGMRVFYESLLIQRNDSKIALKWCTEHGVYPVYEPEIAVKMLQKLAKSSTSRSSSSSKKKKKKRKLNSGDADDFVVDVGMSVGVWEGQGVRDM